MCIILAPVYHFLKNPRRKVRVCLWAYFCTSRIEREKCRNNCKSYVLSSFYDYHLKYRAGRQAQGVRMLIIIIANAKWLTPKFEIWGSSLCLLLSMFPSISIASQSVVRVSDKGTESSTHVVKILDGKDAQYDRPDQNDLLFSMVVCAHIEQEEVGKKGWLGASFLSRIFRWT